MASREPLLPSNCWSSHKLHNQNVCITQILCKYFKITDKPVRFMGHNSTLKSDSRKGTQRNRKKNLMMGRVDPCFPHDKFGFLSTQSALVAIIVYFLFFFAFVFVVAVGHRLACVRLSSIPFYLLPNTRRICSRIRSMAHAITFITSLARKINDFSLIIRTEEMSRPARIWNEDR